MNGGKVIWCIAKYQSPHSRSQWSWRTFSLLEEMVKLGNQAVLITSGSKTGHEYREMEKPVMFEPEAGVDVYWLKGMRYEATTSIRRILSWIEFEARALLMPKKNLPKPDAIIVSSLSPMSILSGLYLRRVYGAKLVAEIRDIWPLTAISSGRLRKSHPFSIFLRSLEKLMYTRADLVVGTMPNLEEHVVESVKHPVPVACIPQGLNIKLMEDQLPLDPSFVQEYIPKDKFIVCYAGGLGPSNAIEPLLEAAKLLEAHADIHFLMVGDGPKRAQLMDDASNIPNITFAPRVDKRQVQDLLQHADVTYFSTNGSAIWRFGQSLNKVIDYMYAARPIIASYTGFPSMINEADCGTFVPANDAPALADEILRYSKKEPEQLEEMGKRGKRWLLENRQFSTLAKKYLENIFGTAM